MGNLLPNDSSNYNVCDNMGLTAVCANLKFQITICVTSIDYKRML